MLCKVISVTNQKGGVGKTTTTVNLGAALSSAGKKVLVVDDDPQGNLTATLGYTLAEQKRTILICQSELMIELHNRSTNPVVELVVLMFTKHFT